MHVLTPIFDHNKVHQELKFGLAYLPFDLFNLVKCYALPRLYFLRARETGIQIKFDQGLISISFLAFVDGRFLISLVFLKTKQRDRDFDYRSYLYPIPKDFVSHGILRIVYERLRLLFLSYRSFLVALDSTSRKRKKW